MQMANGKSFNSQRSNFGFYALFCFGRNCHRFETIGSPSLSPARFCRSEAARLAAAGFDFDASVEPATATADALAAAGFDASDGPEAAPPAEQPFLLRSVSATAASVSATAVSAVAALVERFYIGLLSDFSAKILMIKFYRARSLLYRRQILQENIRWKALDEIYKIYMLLHRSDL